MWIGTALTQHRLCNNKSATGTTTMTAMMMMYDNSENDASECSVHNEHIGPQQMWTMNIRIVEQKIKKKEWQHRQNAMYSICASHKHNQQATTSFCVSMKFFFYTRFFCCWLNECWMLWNLGCGERNTHTHVERFVREACKKVDVKNNGSHGSVGVSLLGMKHEKKNSS